jgi:hypothetical protein
MRLLLMLSLFVLQWDCRGEVGDGESLRRGQGRVRVEEVMPEDGVERKRPSATGTQRLGQCDAGGR